MFNSVYCMARDHNLWIVLLAAIVCIVATGTAVRLTIAAEKVGQRLQVLWLILAGCCGGAGTWATHFIAMLSFDPGVGTGYELIGTLASLLIAIGGSTAGVFASIKAPKPWDLLAWVGLFVLGVGGMHYTGMSALKVAGVMAWNPFYIAASLIVGGAMAGLAFRLGRARSSKALIQTTLGFSAAVCALHFIGMAGVSITPNPSIAVPPSILPHNLMALGVGALTAMILLAALATVLMEARSQSTALNLLRSVIDAIPQGLAYFDADDRFVLGNETYRREVAAADLQSGPGRVFGTLLQQPGEALDISGVAGRDRGTGAPSERPAASRPVASRPAVQDARTPDGRFMRAEYNITRDGGTVTVLSDITGLKAQAEALAAARDAAEAASRAKDDFLANMSHELRTPMNGVVGVADLLAEESLTPRQAELVDLIRTSGATLERLLSDILDFASIQNGGIDIRPAPFDLNKSVKTMRALFASQAADRGLQATFEVATEVEGLFLGDEVRIRQILANLMSNAVKFTQEGLVSLTVELKGDGVRFSVSDSGVGFDAETKARLFSRFEQADGSLTRRFGGAGLGLAISYELTRLMGGALACESTPGVGSVFTLDLPLPRVSERIIAEPEDDDGRPSDAARALIVDDNPTNRRVLTLILEGAGLETAFAENGQEAVDLWAAQPFDIILMDIQMPVMDGLTATAVIRAAEGHDGRDRTPIIMVSANAAPEHVQASYDVGANDHVAKPVTPASLFAAIERVTQPEDDAPLLAGTA
jgi:signal transduction histidine kinase/ActR/RegA family two-component response regulator